MGGDGPDRRAGLPDGRGHVDHGPDEPTAAEPALLGDIVLCPEVAAKQAAAAGHAAADELHLLTVHGVLHLLGYDHAEPDEEREMFGLQAKLLAGWRGANAGPMRSTARRPSRDHAASSSPPALVVLAGLFAMTDAALVRGLAGPGRPSWPGSGVRGARALQRRRRRRRPLPQPAAAAAAGLRADRDHAGRLVAVHRLSTRAGWPCWSPPAAMTRGQLRRGRRRRRAPSAASTRTRSAVRRRRWCAGSAGRSARSPAADPDRQRGHPRQGLPRGPVRHPRSSCASWSTWPSSAAWSSTTSAR